MGKLVETFDITLCDRCDAVVRVLRDINGNRYCGRCKRPVKSMEQISKEYDRRGYGISVGKEGDDKIEQ